LAAQVCSYDGQQTHDGCIDQCAQQAVRASFAQSGLGLRYHLYPDAEQLAVPSGRAGLALAQDCGWAMATAMPAALVCAALQMAIVQRNPPPGLIVHLDRGMQYASAEHQALLKKYGVIGSMSRKGNCWDNSVMERFFLNLKMERVWQKNYANHREAIDDIANYIVGFCNSIRLHLKLGNLSPNAFERESTLKKLNSLSEIT